MIVKEVWFWLIIVGVLLVATALILFIFTVDHSVLSYLLLAAGIVVIIAGVAYAIYQKSKKPLDVIEDDFKTRQTFSDTLTQTIGDFNKNVGSQMKTYAGREYKQKIKENVESQGRNFGAVAGGLVKWAAI